MGPIAVAAYSYMALVADHPAANYEAVLQPKERAIKMENLRPVSKLEKILFPDRGLRWLYVRFFRRQRRWLVC